jgi:hypothetical protein
MTAHLLCQQNAHLVFQFMPQTGSERPHARAASIHPVMAMLLTVINGDNILNQAKLVSYRLAGIINATHSSAQ